jgi:hypothetical protein
VTPPSQSIETKRLRVSGPETSSSLPIISQEIGDSTHINSYMSSQLGPLTDNLVSSPMVLDDGTSDVDEEERGLGEVQSRAVDVVAPRPPLDDEADYENMVSQI